MVHFSVPDSKSSSRLSSSLVPSFVGPYVNGSTWYVAARFTFSTYNERIRGNNFILGSGSKTVDMQDIVYTNRPLEPGMRYSVYCRAIGTDLTGVNIHVFITNIDSYMCCVSQRLTSTSDGVGQ